ncbi:MAG TPA: ABC transporter permease [Xanthobacteraceae bacterium]|nr:ABC transporter permease [Xanthobacteraceae bacterium]
MTAVAEIAPRAKKTPRRTRLWRWMKSDPRAVISISYLLMLLIVSIGAPVLAPYSPTAQDVSKLLLPPSTEHWLGTDDLGRDVLSRLIWGAPNSMQASFIAVSVAILLGVPIGLIIGFIGGWLDEIVSRFIDALLSFPPIVLAIAVTGALGIGLFNAMLSVGIVFAPFLARLVRAQTLVVKNALYVDAARGFGASTFHIIVRHIVPNAIQPVIVQVTLMLAIALLAEASLSFLALGVQPPAASWGGMLARAYNYIEIAPAQMYAPGFAILLTALAFNALGESMRVALDPTMKRR